MIFFPILFTILANQFVDLRKGLFCGLVILLMSCNSDYGHKVVGDNLTVYFTDRNDEKLAETIAIFWKENDLIGETKQDLQLVRLTKKIELRIIANDPKNVKNMSFDERKLLAELEQELQKEIGESPLQLVICNNKFEPIYTPTE